MSHEKPNVLLIMTDQQRWDCVGANGNPVIRTPHLDGLAWDGVTFTNSFTNAAACVPSRACLMTGQYVHAHGVTATSGPLWLRPETPTLPGCFSAGGHAAVGVGKMHFKPWDALSGFDRRVIVDGKYNMSEGGDEYRQALKSLGLSHKTIGHHTPGFGKAFKSMPTTELPPEYYIDAYIGRRGVETLEGLIKEGRPFFLTVSFCGPHDPYDPPPPYSTMYERALMPTGRYREGELDCLPEAIRREVTDMGIEHLNLTTVPEARKREVAAHYYGNISLIDDWVGALLDALKRPGPKRRSLKRHSLYDDTVVLFTSDHGEYLGDHNLYYKAYFPCDSDCKVPLILKAPGVNGGVRNDSLVGNVDVMPTLLEAAGLEMPRTCQGMSLLQTAREGSDVGRDCVVTYSECGPCYRIRTREWAYVFRDGDGYDQLYNLTDDPHELSNLAREPACASVADQLRRRLIQWFSENPAPCDMTRGEGTGQAGHAGRLAPVGLRQRETPTCQRAVTRWRKPIKLALHSARPA